MKTILSKILQYGFRAKRRHLYIFLDEGGNLDFSNHGTKHFILTGVTKERSLKLHTPLAEYKYDLIERGLNIEYFHASEDNKAVRERVFQLINSDLQNLRIDGMIVDKQAVQTSLRPGIKFYPHILEKLIRHILQNLDLTKFSMLLVITDQIPLTHRRETIEKSIKAALSALLPATLPYRVFHHDSKSNFDLQIADYCCWALYRKWERSEERYYRMIQRAIQSELETKLE